MVPLNHFKIFLFRVQVSHAVKQHVVVHFVPEIIPVAAADMRAFIGKIHDDIPAVIPLK